MSIEKEKNPSHSPKKKGKVITALFETKEHKKAEKEWEEYYHRIRNMSRGRV